MPRSLQQIVQGEAYQLVFLQLLGVVMLAIMAWISMGTVSGLSVFAGGCAYGLANFIFVWAVFRYVGARQMAQFMAAFMAFEMLKLLISAFLVLMIVKYLPVSLLSVLVGLIGAIVSFWVVCLWHFTKPRKNR